jgi:hypothetical protein
MGYQSRVSFGLYISFEGVVSFERSVRTNANHISGHQVGTEDFVPFTISECLDGVWGDTHGPELGKSPDSLDN